MAEPAGKAHVSRRRQASRSAHNEASPDLGAWPDRCVFDVFGFNSVMNVVPVLKQDRERLAASKASSGLA